ncbi:hypothetical protein Q5752_000406 [Cryptotrichosporon argae]
MTDRTAERMHEGHSISGFEAETVMPETADDTLREGRGTRSMLSSVGTDSGDRSSIGDTFRDAINRVGEQLSGDSSGPALSKSTDTSSTAYDKGADYSKLGDVYAPASSPSPTTTARGLSLRDDDDDYGTLADRPNAGRHWSFTTFGARVRRWSGTWGDVDPVAEAALIA